MKADRAPVEKEPIAPSRWGVPAMLGPRMWKRPARLAATAVTSRISASTTAGLWNWNDQPISAPAALSSSKAAPSAMHTATVPARYASASRRANAGEWPLRARLIAFKLSTGKTQGMRLSSNPPTKAPSNAVRKPDSVPSLAVTELRVDSTTVSRTTGTFVFGPAVAGRSRPSAAVAGSPGEREAACDDCLARTR